MTGSNPTARSFFDKVWDQHVIRNLGDNTYLLHVDRHFLHELSGAVALKALEEAGHTVRDPSATFATLDHVVDTRPGRTVESLVPQGSDFIELLTDAAKRNAITLFDLESDYQGIVHVIAPELGLILPGTTAVCGDSHTCTLGGLGAVAWGIGSTDCEHVLATQSIVQTRPNTMRVNISGNLRNGATPKDLILKLIGELGANGGSGFAVEFAGSAVKRLDTEGRMTICNMAVELSARLGFVVPDEETFGYLADRPYAPSGKMRERALKDWTSLIGDENAEFDREVDVDGNGLVPQVTWGTSPEHVIDIDDYIPDPDSPEFASTREDLHSALCYARLQPRTVLKGRKIDAAFIGSCTNSRLSDLRLAARFLRDAKVSPGVRAICTPGSQQVKRRAEMEGLDKIFKDAGFEWREPGCSFCISGGLGGESFEEGSRVISTTNRNFENRQGRHVISHLASPATVAYSALKGVIADPREAFG